MTGLATSKECWYQHLTDTVVEPSAPPTAPVGGNEDRKHHGPDDEIPFGTPYTLWDAERGLIVRHITTSWLDAHVRTERGLDDLLAEARATHVRELVIHDDRPPCGNPIYQAFSRRTISAFRTTIQRNGILCAVE